MHRLLKMRGREKDLSLKMVFGSEGIGADVPSSIE